MRMSQSQMWRGLCVGRSRLSPVANPKRGHSVPPLYLRRTSWRIESLFESMRPISSINNLATLLKFNYDGVAVLGTMGCGTESCPLGIRHCPINCVIGRLVVHCRYVATIAPQKDETQWMVTVDDIWAHLSQRVRSAPHRFAAILLR